MKTKNSAPKISENEIGPYLDSLRAVSNLLDESLYVVDFNQRRFHFVSENGIFLNNHLPKDVLKLGYDYFPKLIHKDDYPMAVRIHQEIVRYFTHPASLNDLIYVKFSFRMHHNKRMVMKHTVTPLIVNNKVRMAICTVHHTQDLPGNLCAYHRNKDVYYQYSLENDKWEQEPVISLKSRERKILELSKEGVTTQVLLNKNI